MTKKSKTFSWILYGIALAYLLFPLDFIPDVPLIGLLDDAIAFTLAKVLGDLKK